MSTAVEVFPASLVAVPFETDRSIRGATDISNIFFNAGRVKNITKDVKKLKDPNDFGVFYLANEPQGSTQVVRLYEYSIGQMTIKIQCTQAGVFENLSLQTFISPPNISTVLADNSVGNAKEDISVTLGPADVVEGTVTITRSGSEHHVLHYEVTIKVPQSTYGGEITLPF